MRRAGYALLEVVCALVIMALVAMGSALVHMTYRTMRMRLKQAGEHELMLEIALNRLAHEVRLGPLECDAWSCGPSSCAWRSPVEPLQRAWLLRDGRLLRVTDGVTQVVLDSCAEFRAQIVVGHDLVVGHGPVVRAVVVHMADGARTAERTIPLVQWVMR